MSTNFALVLDTDRQPLSPCHPTRVRDLLKHGKAAVLRGYPFTIILKHPVPEADPQHCQLKLDPGSKTTGIALVQGETVIWGAELNHRGYQFHKALGSRSQRRLNRRSRLRYRKPSDRTQAQINNAKRSYARKRKQGWLAPSLQHRIESTLTWVRRLMRSAPIGELTQELVKFDLHKLQRPEIAGVEYQQGELFGFEVKEYLLEKWGRQCADCGAEHHPLEVEHIVARSRSGSNRVTNLTLACTTCNQRKSDTPIEVLLKRKPERSMAIKAKAKASLRDAGAVNTTRWALFRALSATGLPVSVGTGGQTKFNRKQLGWDKAHWFDAAAVGKIGTLRLALDQPLKVGCRGQGGRQKGVFNKHGQPRYNKRGQAQIRPLKPIHGWRAGDIAKCGHVVRRINPRTSGSFAIHPLAGGKPFNRAMRLFTPIQSQDGYEYA